MPKVIVSCGKLCSGKRRMRKSCKKKVRLPEKFNAIFEKPDPSKIDRRIG